MKQIFRKRARMQYENCIALDETPNSIIYLNVDIQQQDIQQKNIPNSNNKAYKKGEIEKVLDKIYALFDIINLKGIWKKNLQFL